MRGKTVIQLGGEGHQPFLGKAAAYFLQVVSHAERIVHHQHAWPGRSALRPGHVHAHRSVRGIDDGPVGHYRQRLAPLRRYGAATLTSLSTIRPEPVEGRTRVRQTPG